MLKYLCVSTYAQSVEDGLIIALVDCTEHGVPGAFMTIDILNDLWWQRPLQFPKPLRSDLQII